MGRRSDLDGSPKTANHRGGRHDSATRNCSARIARCRRHLSAQREKEFNLAGEFLPGGEWPARPKPLSARVARACRHCARPGFRRMCRPTAKSVRCERPVRCERLVGCDQRVPIKGNRCETLGDDGLFRCRKERCSRRDVDWGAHRPGESPLPSPQVVCVPLRVPSQGIGERRNLPEAADLRQNGVNSIANQGEMIEAVLRPRRSPTIVPPSPLSLTTTSQLFEEGARPRPLFLCAVPRSDDGWIK